jgi:hypothetical protein
MIENKIRKKLKDSFEKELFEAALENFNAKVNKLRLNNFAYAIRELTRIFLARLAPDEDVKKCSWYKNESKDPKQITRGERVKYAIQGGLHDNYVIDHLDIDVNEIKKKFNEIIKLLSKFTHIGSATFNIDDTTATDYKKQTLEILLEFFALIEQSRNEVISRLENEIDDHVFSAAISETHNEIDEVSGSHFISGVYVESHEITRIDSEIIHLFVEGQFEATLEYGSKHDGCSINHSFPFECKFTCKVTSPDKIFESCKDLKVDNSTWYGE